VSVAWSELILPDTLRSAMTTTDTLKPNVDKRLRAGAIASFWRR
jgi:hypothetical protein